MPKNLDKEFIKSIKSKALKGKKFDSSKGISSKKMDKTEEDLKGKSKND